VDRAKVLIHTLSFAVAAHASPAAPHHKSGGHQVRQIRPTPVLAGQQAPLSTFDPPADRLGDLLAGVRALLVQQVQDLDVPHPKIIRPAVFASVPPIRLSPQIGHAGKSRLFQLSSRPLTDLVAVALIAGVGRQPQRVANHGHRAAVTPQPGMVLRPLRGDLAV